MRKRDHNILTNAASLLICGLLAGVVVAAAAFPAIAMSGLAAKAGAETFDKLPTALTVKRSPQISYVYASDARTLLASFYDENRRDIKLADMSKNMQDAMIAAEDHNFYKHHGVDVKGVARAFVANKSANSTQQGASTLTMQFVRLSISYSATSPREVIAATEDTTTRKLQEMRYAMAIEKDMSKQEILERYLNIAPFGNGAYGVYAASQVYFGKAPKDLTIDESAMLAGMVKAPTTLNPTTTDGYPKALERRNYVIANMQQIGAITAAQAEAAKKVKLVVKDKRTPNGCVSTTKNHWGFFCDYFYRWWMSQETFGATSYDRERQLKSGGYRIVSTLDVKAQEAAKKNVEQRLKTGKPEALMVTALEPGSGRVRAMAVNRNYKLDDPANPQNGKSTNPAKKRLGVKGTYPNTTNPLLSGGGDIHGYQAGSVFKLFTAIAALEKGYPLATSINAVSPYKSKYIVNGPSACPGTNRYCPRNASQSMNGVHNMWSGFGRSVNTYFVPLEEMAGAENVVDVAKRMGIQFRAKSGDPDRPQDWEFANLPGFAEQWGAFTLGVSSTTPLDLAGAYATTIADGKYCEPIPVQSIKDHEDNRLDVANPRCRQVIDVEVARAAVDIQRCPVGDRSETSRCTFGTAQRVRGDVGRPVAGKSGTTDAERTASFVVSAKQLTVAAIFADPDWAETTHLDAYGDPHAAVVNPAAYETLRDALKGAEKKGFTPPSGKIVYGDQRSIPDVTCQTVDTAKQRLRGAGFKPYVENDPVPSPCPAGTVARTDPDGRTIKGGFVMIRISDGKGAKPGGGNNGGGDRAPTLPCPPFCRRN